LLRETLAARQYDIIVDMHALMKSVWIVRQARGGVRHGLN
jgi:heptosyltransferase-1